VYIGNYKNDLSIGHRLLPEQIVWQDQVTIENDVGQARMSVRVLRVRGAYLALDIFTSDTKISRTLLRTGKRDT
jgi:hypothetical protein